MKDVSLGHLRHRLLIEIPHDEPDGAGGLIRTYNASSYVWGAIIPMSGQAEFIIDRRNMTITHKIMLRWRDDLTQNIRLRLQNRCFLIQALWDQDERRRFLICLCEEVTA